ncbi:YggS family pyridoxal phosphate-dependent enzyme [Paraflavisolibacter sp. H34]|uniref:YggS family pyridoxal phosphate-dependent enzyme n=1 Tax=Huijunlia imazamoxiresistens TaxID=3127457 RepID=UPI00301A1D58
MLINQSKYEEILGLLQQKGATLVAVSKTKPVEAIRELYELGQRDFGENYVQELTEKQALLPADIRWHFIGHLQTNKVKYIVPFVHLVHGVDSARLLQEIHKQAAKAGRVVDVLLQVHIAREETKFGWDEAELDDLLQSGAETLKEWKNIRIKGLMGMASFTEDKGRVRNEFDTLKELFDKYKELFPEGAASNVSFEILSMGMSGDYALALEEGSNMVRIGSLIFGARKKAE